MRIFNKFKGTKGFISTWERVIRFRYMITEQAKQRTRILAFWEKHGLVATREAFNVSRPTLFRWQKDLKDGGGKLEALNKQSTAPRKRRKRIIPQEVQDFILIERKPRELRVKLRSKGHTGGLVKADSIVRFTNGLKRYIVTAIDKENKFAFAYAYKNHSSDSATDFMKKFKSVAPLQLTHVQTDNGSEFEHHFEIYLEKNNIVHFHTYPRCPKMNTEIERFNRTLSDAFIKQNRYLLAYDIDTFNQKLIDWLLWYNTRRPHWTLGLVSPMQYIVSTLSAEESHMLWTDTRA